MKNFYKLIGIVALAAIAGFGIGIFWMMAYYNKSGRLLKKGEIAVDTTGAQSDTMTCGGMWYPVTNVGIPSDSVMLGLKSQD